MPFNGSGTFNLVASNPVVTGTTISSTWANNTLSDIANNGLTNTVPRDGQASPTANLPMGGFRHTGVGNAQARTDYAAAGQAQDGSLITLGAVSGTDTITASVTPSIPAYVAGQSFRFISAGVNTTNAVTININGLGAKNVIKYTPGNPGYNTLSPGDIQSGQVAVVTYNGTAFELQSPIAQGSPFTFRNKLINGNFSIWQRGTNFGPALPYFYGPDRWKYTSANGTGNAQLNQSSTGFANGLQGKYYLTYIQNSPPSSNNPPLLNQFIEGVGTLSGKYVTLTIMASYSITGGSAITVTPQLIQSFGTGGSPSANVTTTLPTITLTTTPTVYTVSAQLPSVAGKTLGTNGDDYLWLSLNLPANTTFTMQWYYVQLEEGGTPTPFEYRPPQTELALCRRYYEGSGAEPIWSGNSQSGNTYYSNGIFKETKRITPTVTVTGVNANGFTAGAVSVAGTVTTTGFFAQNNATATVNGGFYTFSWTASAEF